MTSAVLSAHALIHTNQSHKTNMAILDNLEAYLDLTLDHPNLATKIFSENVCEQCSCRESKPMPITDNMGREIFWEQQELPQS